MKALGRFTHSHVQDLDSQRKGHGEVNVAFVDFLANGLGYQHDSNQDQETECQRLDGWVRLDEFADRPSEDHHDDDRYHDCGNHDREFLGHTYGRNHGVERKHDIQDGDFKDDDRESLGLWRYVTMCCLSWIS